MNKVFLFVAFYVAPLAALILVAFADGMRAVGLVLFVALLIFHMVRSRDFHGHRTVMGIRKDSKLYKAFFGRQRGPNGDELK